MSMRTLQARIQYNGGSQLDRIRLNKLRSFRAALEGSYDTRSIKVPNKSVWKCLLNTDDTKQDYDIRTLSVEYDSGLEPGSTFEVLDNHTHWMCLLQDIVETAYYKTTAIRRRYTIDVNGNTYWIYCQGPTELTSPWYIKQSISFNEMNYSSTVYITKDENTDGFFKRFDHIVIDGRTWEVEVVDQISVPGIIELELNEYFENTPMGLPEVIKVDDRQQIVGLKTVGRDCTVGYEIEPRLFDESYRWTVTGNPRVELESVEAGGKICKVKVHPGAVRTYRVSYGNGNVGYHLDVTIDSTANPIHGKAEVRPYDVETYTTDVDGTFHVESKLARVVKASKRRCEVEVLTGKSGEFTVYFDPDGGDGTVELPVSIRSL
jgi:hypothetical protein